MKTYFNHFLIFSLVLFSSNIFANSDQFLSKFSNSKKDRKFLKDELGMVFAKFVVEMDKNNEKVKAFYIMNPKKFEWHLDFLGEILHVRMKPQNFTKGLFSNKPTYLAGTLFILPQNKLGFNIITQERGSLDAKKYKLAKDILNQNITGFEALIPLINSDKSLDFTKNLTQSGLNGFQTIEATFASSRPVVYNQSLSYGYLRVMDKSEAEKGEYGPRDILALSDIPLDVGPISGIITSLPQTPNSHVYLRALELRIPNVYLPIKQFKKTIKGKAGKLIQLHVDKSGKVTIKDENELPDIDSLAKKFFAKKTRSGLEVNIKAETWKDSYLIWDNKTKFDKEMQFMYGSKAINFALLDKALSNKFNNRKEFKSSFLIPFNLHKSLLDRTLLFQPMCKRAFKKCKKIGYTQYCSEINSKCEDFAKENYKRLTKSHFNKNLYGDVNERLKFLYNKQLNFFTAYEFNSALIKNLDTNIVWTKNLKTLEKYIVVTKVKDLIKNPKMRKSYLSYLRELIMVSPIKSLDKILKSMRENLPLDRKWRARSSTNAEDLPFFTGAGLYSSKALCVYDTLNSYSGPSKCRTKKEKTKIFTKLAFYKLRKKTKEVKKEIAYLKKKYRKRYSIPESLKKVIASVYNDEAVLFRDHYGIPQEKVYMGILTHPSVDDERANGVAIVKVDNNQIEYSISSQRDDILVTNPSISGATAEEVVFMKDLTNKKITHKYKSYSNILNKGRKEVLSRDQLKRLMKEIDVIIQAMEGYYFKGYGKKYDIEFILSDANEIIILQIRPLEQGKREDPINKLAATLKKSPIIRLNESDNKHGWNNYIFHTSSDLTLMITSGEGKGAEEIHPSRPSALLDAFFIYEGDQIVYSQPALHEGEDLFGFCKTVSPSDSKYLKDFPHLLKNIFPKQKVEPGKICNLQPVIGSQVCYVNIKDKHAFIMLINNTKKGLSWKKANDKDLKKNFESLPSKRYSRYSVFSSLIKRVEGCLNKEKFPKIKAGFLLQDGNYGGLNFVYNFPPPPQQLAKILGKDRVRKGSSRGRRSPGPIRPRRSRSLRR